MTNSKPVRIAEYNSPWRSMWAVYRPTRNKTLIGIYSTMNEAMIECAKAGLEYRLEKRE